MYNRNYTNPEYKNLNGFLEIRCFNALDEPPK